jgi:hypothetical protein
MESAQVAFAGVLPEDMWPEVTPVKKCVLPMRNRKLRNIRPSWTFSPEVTSVSHVIGRGPVWKRPWPEICSAHSWLFPAFFLSSSTILIGSDVRLTSPEEALTGSMLCGSTVFPRLFLSSRIKCWLGVFSTTSASLFSDNASLYVITNCPDRGRYYLVAS